MPDPTLEFMQRLNDPGLWRVEEDVPIFDCHDVYDQDGKLAQRFDAARLANIVNTYNRRVAETGSVARIGPGHTKRDPEAPENEQPPVFGFIPRLKLGRFGPSSKLAVLADLYFRKECYDQAMEYPCRSVEIFPGQDLIDWLALLRRSPRLDLGMLTYKKVFSDSVFSVQRRLQGPLITAPLNTEPLLYYQMETAMPETVVQQPPAAAAAAPAAEFTPEEKAAYAKVCRYLESEHPAFKAMCSKYAAEGGGAGGAAGAPGPGVASSTNAEPPKLEPDKDKERMQRDSQALHYARLEQQVAELQQATAAANLRYQRAECERIVTQLEGEGYDLDRAAEVERMTPLTPEQRTRHVAYVRHYHRRAPVSQGPIQIFTGHVEGQSGAAPVTREQRDAAVKLAGRKGVGFNEALEEVKKSG